MNSRDLLTWGMIIMIIGLAGYLAYYVKTESYQCMTNPYTYSIKLLEKANGGDVNCLCTAISPRKTVSVLLGRDGFTPVTIRQDASTSENYSNFTVTFQR